MKNYEGCWLGSEASFQVYVEAVAYALENKDKAKAAMDYHRENVVRASMFIDDEEDYEPFFDIIEQHGDIGVINLTGSLVAEESWINSMFGMISYESIIHAIDYFLSADDVTKIVLNIDTGGGEVGGLDTAGDVIEEARKKKPVYAHVNGAAFSAGYWLASSAQSINSTAMSETGSIGVLIVHKSMKKALEERGIDITLIAAGKQKGLGHPSKELSESDKAVLQNKADTLYSFFLEKIVASRSMLSLSSKDIWAEGKTFFAAEAQQVGLIDTIVTTTQFFQALKVDKNSSGANNSNLATYSQEIIMPKSVILSQKDNAALASGADLGTLDYQEEEDVAALVTAASEVLVAGGDEAAAIAAALAAGGDEASATAAAASAAATIAAASAGGDDDEAAAAAAATLAAEEAAAALAAAPAGEGSATMLAQLGTLTTENANLRVENTRLMAEAGVADTSISGLTAVAIEATHKMQIALNSEPLDMAELPASTILAQYQKVKAKFEATFKVGQQSSSAAGDQQDNMVTLPELGIVQKAQK